MAEFFAMSSDERKKWYNAAKLAKTKTNGCGLWYFWRTKNDRQALATIERQSGVQLID